MVTIKGAADFSGLQVDEQLMAVAPRKGNKRKFSGGCQLHSPMDQAVVSAIKFHL